MLKVFCDWCGVNIGPASKQSDSTKERGLHLEDRVNLERDSIAVDGPTPLRGELHVVVHVVPPEGQHVCRQCAELAIEEALGEQDVSPDERSEQERNG